MQQTMDNFVRNKEMINAFFGSIWYVRLWLADF